MEKAQELKRNLKGLIFWGQLKARTMYLLTEWEGRTENIWREVMAYGPSAARSVRPDRGAKYFRVRPDLTQLISILSYDNRAFPFFFFVNFFFRVIKFGMFT